MNFLPLINGLRSLNVCVPIKKAQSCFYSTFNVTILNFSKYKSKWLIKYLLICRMKTINS